MDSKKLKFPVWENGRLCFMSRILRLSLVLSIFLSTINTYAQNEPHFSEEPAAFIEELKEFFASTENKDLKKTFQELSAWMPGLELTEVASISAFCNKMHSLKFNAYPYYNDYFQALGVIYGSNMPGFAKTWQKAAEDAIDAVDNNRYRDVSNFFKFSKTFFLEKKVVDSKAGANWFVTDKQPKFSLSEEGDLLLTFKDIDVSASRKKDSLIIYNTSGVFNIKEKIWKGQGGKISWWRYGQDDVYCELDSFTIDMKRPLFEINKVKFYHPELFPGRALEGKIQDKVYSIEDDTTGIYPKFDGREGNVNLDKLVSGIELKGSFSLHGTTIYIAKTEGQSKATLRVVKNQSTDYFNASADRFKIGPGRVFTRSANILIPIGTDHSITHPAVSLDYKTETEQLKLGLGEGLQAQSPYFNTYHGYNFSASDMIYDIPNDTIFIGKKSLGLGKVQSEIIFESPRFFKQSEYLRVQNIGSVNPLARLNQLVGDFQTRSLDLASVIDAINPNLNEQSIQSLLADLVKLGFIEYNAAQKTILVKNKTLHYAEAAKQNTDYDNFRIESDSKNENGILQLKNNDLLLSGVKYVSFSDSQKVAIKPFFNEITLQRGNQLKMHGKLFAGYSTLEGLDFFYNYPEHKITLDSVKYFQLFIPTGNKINGGEDEAIALNSRIESMSAVLRVDAPNNKSSLVNIPIFPSLHSRGKSYVYYDDKSIRGGLYTRDSFYFQLDEFDIDGLDQLDSNEVVFNGELFTKDIIEPFRDSLIVREDLSLGLVAETPSDGYVLYRDKGNYKGQIDLSNQGLLGKGEVSYLKSQVNSEDIVFLPKQMTASADEFNLEGVEKESEEIPKVKGIDVRLNWKPYQDSMYINSEEAPFALYEKALHQFKGALIYTPGGLKGDGLLDWSKGSIRSELVNFGYDSAQSDTLDLNIRAAAGEKLAFDSKNLNGELDFSKNYGKFLGNSDEINTRMPANQFKTNFNDFDWDMNKSLVIFKDQKGGDGVFVSTHEEMDSLDIVGKRARYDLQTNELTIKDAPVVRVADALIYPVDSTIIVRENARIDTLYNAIIVADTINQYHEIKKAKVLLQGKKDYKASGYYQYNIAGKNQEVLFDNIVGARVGKGSRSEKRTETRASGSIAADDNFYIDNKTLYQGSIQLEAQRQALKFSGFARFDIPTLRSDSTWFSVDFIGDKNNLILSYDTPKTLEGYPVETGIFLNKESSFVYPAVMTSLYSRQDRPLIDMQGVVDYIPEKKILRMGDSIVVLSAETRGNLMEFDETTAGVKARGQFHLCEETPLVEVEAYGIMRTEDKPVVFDSLGFATLESESSFEVMGGINFFIPDPLKKHIIKDISAVLVAALDEKYNDVFYDEVAYNFVKEDQDIPKFSEQLLLGNMVIPDKYNNFDVVIGKTPLQWVPDYQSFISTKKNNPFISIDKLGIHKKFESYVEFKMPSNGDDRAYLYFELPNNNFYFFGMKDATLFTVSNNPIYNDKVDELKGKEKNIKVDKGIDLEVVLADQATAKRFVARVKDRQ